MAFGARFVKKSAAGSCSSRCAAGRDDAELSLSRPATPVASRRHAGAPSARRHAFRHAATHRRGGLTWGVAGDTIGDGASQQPRMSTIV